MCGVRECSPVHCWKRVLHAAQTSCGLHRKATCRSAADARLSKTGSTPLATFPACAEDEQGRAVGHRSRASPVLLPEQKQGPWIFHQGCQLSLLQDILKLLVHILGAPDLLQHMPSLHSQSLIEAHPDPDPLQASNTTLQWRGKTVVSRHPHSFNGMHSGESCPVTIPACDAQQSMAHSISYSFPKVGTMEMNILVSCPAIRLHPPVEVRTSTPLERAALNSKLVQHTSPPRESASHSAATQRLVTAEGAPSRCGRARRGCWGCPVHAGVMSHSRAWRTPSANRSQRLAKS